MKLREAMSSQRDDPWLRGIVERDAAYFGGKNRKPNKAEDRRGVDQCRSALQAA
jgi:hypothetical protein